MVEPAVIVLHSFVHSFGSGGSYDSDILYLYTLEGFLSLATLCLSLAVLLCDQKTSGD